MKKLFLTGIVAAVVTGIAVYSWYNNALEPLSDDTVRQTFLVTQGQSVQQIASALQEDGLIRSARAFEWYARRNGLSGKLQAGHFVLQASLSTPEIIEVLQQGKSEEVIITIPEGFTIAQMDALLAEKQFLEPGELIACAKECDFSEYTFLPDSSAWLERSGQIEGYLYPDTYFVVLESFSAESFLKRMLRTFQQKVTVSLGNEIAQNRRSAEEIITMASLIEKEAITNEERPVISGILWKRYDAERGLGVDATVRYLVNKQTEPITRQDLDTNDPYNTRKFRGLPPGPIASPGMNSIKAAMYPEKSNYWYYLHAPDGQIHYAETNDGHNANKLKYLR